MGYETSQFGDQVTGNNVTSDVNNHYGLRETGDTQGIAKTEGFRNELTFDLDGTAVGNEAFTLLAPKIPAGSLVESVVLEVSEAFVLGGTTPAISIGTETSESTNGFDISEAQAEATGTYDVTATLAGTWAAGLAAETTLGIDLTGTSPTVTAAGQMRVVIKYINMNG